MPTPWLVWLLFNLLILLLLYLDLAVFQRQAHVIKIKEALLLSAFWIFLALLFNLFIYFWQGRQAALEYLTGYLIEKSLSVDNLFVFLMIFRYFHVPREHQPRVLYWGIIGALIMRLIFILAGVALINRFHWTIYLLGAFLIYTGTRMGLQKGEGEIHPERNPVLRLARKIVPVTKHFYGHRFFVRGAGKVLATPLLIVILVIETTDIMFAVDSIPAILAITLHPFIVYSSNIFAILGLRALYFALAGMMEIFHHLHYGLAFILVFVGFKMILSDVVHIPIGIALGTVGLFLTLSVLTSFLFPDKAKSKRPSS